MVFAVQVIELVNPSAEDSFKIQIPLHGKFHRVSFDFNTVSCTAVNDATQISVPWAILKCNSLLHAVH
jgi:hypothetical protein